MDADFDLDLGEIKRTLDVSDVVSLYFPRLGKTLLIDLRTSDVEGPMVKVVPQAASAEERLRSLRKLRPRFPRPERLSLIPWPKFVDSLVRLGIWEHLIRRCSEAGSPSLIRDCERCLNSLRSAEAAELRNAIKGEGFETMWQRKPRRR
jgi:hypothetical protein